MATTIKKMKRGMIRMTMKAMKMAIEVVMKATEGGREMRTREGSGVGCVMNSFEMSQSGFE